MCPCKIDSHKNKLDEMCLSGISEQTIWGALVINHIPSISEVQTALQCFNPH